MAYTTDDLAALQAALARGEQRVTFADRTVEYRSVAELRLAMRDVEAALAREAGRTRTRQIRIDSDKGFA